MADSFKIKKVGSGTSKKDKVTVYSSKIRGSKRTGHTVVADSEMADKNYIDRAKDASKTLKGSGKSKKGSVTVTLDHKTGRHRVKFTGNGTSSP